MPQGLRRQLLGSDDIIRKDNSRLPVADQQRELSPIIQLRKFNNWVKSTIIARATEGCEPGIKVLDLGCGQGGDLLKWGRESISLYVGVGQTSDVFCTPRYANEAASPADFSDESIRQARQRFEKLRNPGFVARFIVEDWCAVRKKYIGLALLISFRLIAGDFTRHDPCGWTAQLAVRLRGNAIQHAVCFWIGRECSEDDGERLGLAPSRGRLSGLHPGRPNH